jgi:restriction endonuclease S subunit
MKKSHPWPEIKIKEFADVVTGGTPSTRIKEYWEDGTIPWLNSGELNNRYITKSSNHITEAGLKNSNTKIMPVDTVLIALTGATTGVTALLKTEACANQSVTGILPSSRHDPTYLYFYLGSLRQRILDKSWGGAQKHISQGYIKEIGVPLPPIFEQRRIATILDKSDILCRRREEAVGLIGEMLRSTFLEMFGAAAANSKGWPTQPLRAFCSDIADCPHATPDYSPKITTFPCVRSSDLQDGRLVFESTKYVSKTTYLERIRRLKPLEGDIVFCREGARLGNSAIIPDGITPCLGQRTMVFRVDRKVATPEYLIILLNDPSVKKRLLTKVIGAAAPRVNVGELIELELMQPPLEIQQRFAAIYRKIDLLQKSALSSQALFGETQRALVQAAFRGEL